MQDKAPDGLFTLPYNPHDWAVLAVFFTAYLVRMYMMRRNPETRNPTLEDWAGIFFISLLFAVPSYEFAIANKMNIETFYPVLAVEILVAKDLLDFLMLSKEGRRFVLETFKEMLSVGLGKIGFVKKE